ncbi:DUF455 family protein [Engelhardtia mirabilis]|uniref:DUF455 family protein n=1 Tax=Engelhardtia mirabilis TaxID=2528011 RepID=A0A518BLC6_9BACT|nr:hypothetical protein Pla133_28710 [Planctomycetes bacterium Pla133]QDV02108.1 hypothetical protein Pla86_28700 [Planctomycetes bacterium Pla86]
MDPGDGAPRAGSLERWCQDLVLEPELERKLAFARPPRVGEVDPPERRLAGPGRPGPGPEDRGARRSVRPGSLADPRARARLLHTFLHHEIQAAELMAWAVLAFPTSPPRFRRGLAAIAFEELGHARLLAAQIERLGARIGEFPLRDWFWERVPSCATPAQFVSLMGVGLEGANLDHAEAWAQRLRSVGDEASAQVQERIGRDEIAHVRFAARWLERFEGAADFETWRGQLPAPLTPAVLRGKRLALAARSAAGLDRNFSQALDQWIDVAPCS